MVKEKPKNFYISKPKSFGNGARLKAYKDHINKEMVIMKKDYLKNLLKDVKSGKIKEISDKKFDKIEAELAEKWDQE